MDSLGPQIRRELGRFGPAAGMGELVKAWPDRVGDGVARNAWPARFARDGTLIVHTKDSTWAFELGQQQELIKTRLKELAPPSIKFVPGPLPEPIPEEPDAVAAAPPVPGERELRLAEEAASAIEDDRLRELVARAAAASLARSADDRAF